MKKTYLIHLLTLIAFPSISQVGNQNIKVHYINIGQADATLVEFECGVILIDAGAQIGSKAHQRLSSERLINYLNEFFERREDLKKEISTILITHNHNDHTESLDEIGKYFNVKAIVSTEDYLSKNKDVPKFARSEGAKVKYLNYQDAINYKPNGLYYQEIDPFDCNGYGPVIKVYSGEVGLKERTEVNGEKFYPSYFSNPNNNSLVIKVEYGEASFIFTGDLQEKGIEYLAAQYVDYPELFKSDVYQAGHHGSHNATDSTLLQMMDPKITVISAGHHSQRGLGTAFDYGHPNKEVIELINLWPSMEKRAFPVDQLIFDGEETTPFNFKVSTKTYCTCWENNIVIIADPETGEMWVSSSP